jgi:hypothetical protein
MSNVYNLSGQLEWYKRLTADESAKAHAINLIEQCAAMLAMINATYTETDCRLLASAMLNIQKGYRL